MMPLKGSSAICAGSTSNIDTATYSTDQRGFPLPASDCASGLVDQGAVQSNYLTVNSTADTATGNYHACTTGGTCTLRDAIAAAGTGPSSYNSFAYSGDILFDATVFGSTQQTISLGSSLPQIYFPLSITGPGANLLTVNGNGSIYLANNSGGVSNSILYYTSQSPASVSGITLTNGIPDPNAAEAGGGAVYNGGALTVANSAITNSSSPAGSSEKGGGILNDSSAMLLLTGSTVSGNTAISLGGGIFNLGGMLVTNSTLAGNTADGQGGGINSVGVAAVSDSTISGNTGVNVGGFMGIPGKTQLTNSIVAGNTSSAMSTDDCINCGDVSSDIVDTVAHTTANGAYKIALGTLALNPSTASVPVLVPGPDSVAICAGTASLLPVGLSTDQRGFPRLNTTYSGYSSGTPCLDIGAVQTNYTSIQFSQQPSNTLLTTAITPSPTVTVQETNSGTSATDNVSGAPIALTLNGTAGGVTGTLTAATNASGVATFSGLTGSIVGTGYTFSVAGSSIISGTAVSSSSFDVYPPAPTVTGITPTAGPAAGGTTVTITGTNFSGATAVSFGGTAATGFTVNSATSITATSPAGTGTVDVTVRPQVAPVRRARRISLLLCPRLSSRRLLPAWAQPPAARPSLSPEPTSTAQQRCRSAARPQPALR